MRLIFIVIPEIRGRDALAAVERRLFNVGDYREIGYPATVRHRAPDILIPDNNGPTGNAKRFALTRNKEDRADAGICSTYRRGGYRDDPEWQGSHRQTPYESRATSLWRQQPGTSIFGTLALGCGGLLGSGAASRRTDGKKDRR